jgi:hypothetical protein
MNDSTPSQCIFKECSRCKNTYPRTREYFPPDKRREDGMSSWCRICKREDEKQRREGNLDYYLQKEADRREKNRDAIRRDQRNWYERHGDNARVSGKIRTRKYSENNREEIRERVKRNRQEKPEIYRAEKLRRRAREYSLPDNFTPQDWKHAVEYFNGCCAACGRPPGLWHKLAADHWIAIADPNCPGTVPTNIVPLCWGIDGCNNRKSKKPADKWLIEEFGKRKAAQILKRISEYFESVKK